MVEETFRNQDFADPRPPDATLPTGTVTFLFTDIEGSTRLWQAFPAAMGEALSRHHALLQQAVNAHNGYVFQIVGDAICAAFRTAADGVAAALGAQHALARESWGETGPLRVRMALHTGSTEARAGAYRSGEYASGLTLSRTSRLLSAGHGGQILLSHATEELVRDDLPAHVGLRDLGERRLRDLVRAEHIFQIVGPDQPSEFPPLKTLDAMPNNLPVQVTSFVGREREIRDVTGLLGETHLLTLLGPGGTGKTRLSLQIAANLIETFVDGVWFVELAPLYDPVLVPQTVASAVSVREEAERPLITTLTEHLRARSMLLIFDNCEHLVDACARLADALLRSCPRLKVLASSREALRTAGEVTYRVPSLSLPDPQHLPPLERLTDYEGVRLLVERASAVKPGFKLTDANAAAAVQICHRLDGIPLAIELAAARLKVLSPREIAEHLDERFRLLTAGSRTVLPRHQTLRGLIDWSYELLSEPERAVLRSVSVFAGGWNLAAAEAVDADALDLIGRLVDKSLVVADEEGGETRYSLLETIRQYGLEKLREAGEEPVIRSRHRDFYLALAESAAPHLQGQDQATWFRRLENAHDNLRAALRWSFDHGNIEASFRFGAALDLFWDTHGHITEGRQWLEQMVARSGELPAPATARSLRAHAGALGGAAHMALRQSDFARAKALYVESLELWRAVGDRGAIAEVLNNLGDLVRQLGDRRQGKAMIEESLTLFREVADKRGIAHALSNLADIFLADGDQLQAKRLFEESLPLFQATADRRGLSHGLNNLGGILTREGDYARAEARYRDSLRLAEELEDKHAIATAQRGLGEVARHQRRFGDSLGLYRQSHQTFLSLDDKYCAGKSLLGLGWLAHETADLERATSLAQEALALYREIKVPVEEALALNLLGRLALHEQRLDTATDLLKQSLAIQRTVSDAAGIATNLEDLARVAHARDKPRLMAQLLATADALRQSNGISLSARELESFDRAVASARGVLDDATFRSAWATGAGSPPEDILRLVDTA
jgi:predicted ATPase/class 3 adenylate cyclase